MNSNANIVASFQDRFGEERHIHATRNGLTLMRRGETTNQKLSKAISGYVGERVRHYRRAKGMSAEELCYKAGLSCGGTAKQRIYEIEKNKRSIGIRFGTVYQLAIALNVQITDLLPSVEAVREATGATVVPTEQLRIA